MPEGHLPVTSYFAVPVCPYRRGIRRSFFGHPETDVFTERSVRIVEGLAGQVAIAMENARLYEATQSARDEAEQVAEEKERMRQEQSGPSR
jgi:GAF domain-containing protein